jgi:hypothetical protein
MKNTARLAVYILLISFFGAALFLPACERRLARQEAEHLVRGIERLVKPNECRFTGTSPSAPAYTAYLRYFQSAGYTEANWPTEKGIQAGLVIDELLTDTFYYEVGTFTVDEVTGVLLQADGRQAKSSLGIGIQRS